MDNVKKTCNQSLTKLMDQLQRLELVNVNFHSTVELHYTILILNGPVKFSTSYSEYIISNTFQYVNASHSTVLYSKGG